jgi:hypothetical protein
LQESRKLLCCMQVLRHLLLHQRKLLLFAPQSSSQPIQLPKEPLRGQLLALLLALLLLLLFLQAFLLPVLLFLLHNRLLLLLLLLWFLQAYLCRCCDSRAAIELLPLLQQHLLLLWCRDSCSCCRAISCKHGCVAAGSCSCRQGMLQQLLQQLQCSWVLWVTQAAACLCRHLQQAQKVKVNRLYIEHGQSIVTVESASKLALLQTHSITEHMHLTRYALLMKVVVASSIHSSSLWCVESLTGDQHNTCKSYCCC